MIFSPWLLQILVELGHRDQAADLDVDLKWSAALCHYGFIVRGLQRLQIETPLGLLVQD
ncbi:MULTISPECIES: hypothetical protein [unclassified Streptomyces]|uniref:hypothetical protein n=1 Tax=unclassified Streptomyces TaxID=2593676 RepID=UPI000B2712E9|nr:hypothetical protein [Streptomyces sp. TSRI0281]